MSKIMYLDLETQNHEYFGAKASPRHPQNYVVLNGWAVDDGPINHIRNDNIEEAKSRDWLYIPDDVTLIVAHNAPFEVDWFLVQQREIFMKFLARGGRIFCTAYAHYLLSNQLDTYPALDDIAPMYGGEHKVDGVKVLWQQGVLTSDIDPALLLEYLVSPRNGDVANTRVIFKEQYQQLAARNMLEMAWDRMDGMLYCCFAMDSGLFVDRTVAAEQLHKGNLRLAELSARFKAVRHFMPPELEFKESSDFHMSAWLFGGPIKYKTKVPKFNDDGSVVYEKMDAAVIAEGPYKGRTVQVLQDDNGPEYILAEGKRKTLDEFSFDHFELERYKAGKNKGAVKVSRHDSAVQKMVWAEALFPCPPLVDMRLVPDAVSREFFKEYSGKRKLADESPVISTGSDALEKLVTYQWIPEEVRLLIKDLLEFAKLDKDIGTYYLREERDDDGNVTKRSGMLQFVNDIGIINHVLNCTSTVTTRLSGTRPNMQNTPRGDTSDVKNMFTSRFQSLQWIEWAFEHGYIDAEFHKTLLQEQAIPGFQSGHVAELDYSALEVVTLAAFSQDQGLIKALVEGIDMHTLRLSKKLRRPYEELMAILEDKEHPEHKEIKTARTNIKPRAFAYQYGATAMGIAFSTGCSVEEAQEFIDNEKALFPGVESWYSDVIFKSVEQNITQHNEQRDDGSWRLFKRGVWQSQGGTTYSFRQYEKNVWHHGQKLETMEFKPTQMRNYPIQGESGFFVQGISGLVMRWLVSQNFFGGRVWIINQVHDALYLDVHHSVRDLVLGTVKRIMEYLPTYFSSKYGYSLNVPFPAAAEFGVNMNDKEHWHEQI